MPIIELQIRKATFLELVKRTINARRLPAPTLNLFFLPQLEGRPLQRIECTGCSMAASEDDQPVVVTADLVFHYNNSLAEVRAAGSLKAPTTHTLARSFPLTFSVDLTSTPGQPALRWSLPFNVIPGGTIPFDLPQDLGVVVAGVRASDDAIAIRLGTRGDDPVRGPVVNRVVSHEWVQIIEGQVFGDFLGGVLRATTEQAKSTTLLIDTPASGAWFPAWGARPPFAGASCTMVAVDACEFDIDVPVDLQLTLNLEPQGHSLRSTVTLQWDPDSTFCEIVMGILLTPFMSLHVHGAAADKAAETILGKAPNVDGFREIHRDDERITYQRDALIGTPSTAFKLSHAEITNEGLVTGGSVSLRATAPALTGSATLPTSTLEGNCNTRRVQVVNRPATVTLWDFGLERGSPRIFPDGVYLDPPNAWTVAPIPNPGGFESSLVFLDPPQGRLAAGTATSVYLHTDRGMRWIDLGVIPQQHAPPTTADTLALLNRCMAKSDPWGLGPLNLDWLVDPPDVFHGIDPVRIWSIALRDLPPNAQIEVVARHRDGRTRPVTVVEGQRQARLDVITDADESVVLRPREPFAAATPSVWQRWLVPRARIGLEGRGMHVAAVNGTVGVAGPGVLSLFSIDFSSDQRIHLRRLSAHERLGTRVRAIEAALARQEGHGTGSVARLSRGVLAVLDRGALLMGHAAPPVKL